MIHINKTLRKKGIHRMPMAKIPKVAKIGSAIKTPAFPKLPKLPTKFTNKSKY